MLGRRQIREKVVETLYSYYQNPIKFDVLEKNGEASFEKHKIYLYKEDFTAFHDMFSESTNFIINEKGEDVISEKHEKDFKSKSFTIDSDDEI